MILNQIRSALARRDTAPSPGPAAPPDDRDAEIGSLRVQLAQSLRARTVLEDQVEARDELIAALREATDRDFTRREGIYLVLNRVPGLSQGNGDDQAADVQEVADRLRSAEARLEGWEVEAGREDPRDAQIAAMTAVLERFAAPGVTVPAAVRRRDASDVLRAVQEHADTGPEATP